MTRSRLSKFFGRTAQYAKQEQLRRRYSPQVERMEDRIVPANILVNNPVTDLTQDTQSETSTLAFGSTVLVSFNDSGSFISGSSNHFTGWSRSIDGGNTFTDLGTLPGNDDFGDPVFARNNTTGTVFLTTLNGSGSQINIFRSTNGGLTFGPAINASPGTGLNTDKEWLTVDNFAGPGNGNVYMAVRDFGTSDSIKLFRSTDDGLTFGPNNGVNIVTGLANQGAQVTVGPDHSVYVFWFENSGGQRLRVRRSTDQGQTFGAPVTVATLSTTGTNGDLGLGAFRTSAFAQAVVNPNNGNVYVVYPDNPAGTDRADIFFRQSTDLGTTWSAPIRVNNDATTNDQWQPGLAIRPDGSQLFVGWYDRRLDPANTMIDNFGRVAAISGSTVNFGPDFRITDVSYGVVVGVDPVINTTYMGDYDQPSADNTFFYYSWGDNRDNSNGRAGKQANVRFMRIPGLTSFPFITGSTPNGLVGTPVSSLTFSFSTAMDQTSFNVAQDVVSFNGPGGNLLGAITGFSWNGAGTQLTINFTTQSALGSYSMVLGPQILSTGGSPLDNNFNGTPGESPGDNFNGPFDIGADFGDAPNSFGTTLASNGARHFTTGPSLGAGRDVESDASTPLNGTGDDVTGTDDEDGVTPGIMIPGSTGTFTVNVQNGSGFLNAWVDINADGDFSEAGEQIATNLAVAPGNNTVTYAIPSGAPFGIHYARFRLTSASVATPSPVGMAPDGEVEDYALNFNDGTLCENFDTVTAPALPTGWISVSASGSSVWTTTTATPFSAPNAAFVTDAASTSDTSLVSPVFTYTLTSSQLIFNNFYQTESGFDFATLDISINGGAFTDILSAGGSFVTGGYNSASGWTGSSGSYILTTVNLPASGLGQVVQLRWQLTTDSSVGANGWRVDDVCTQAPPTLDFGDAPNSFGTTLASNGARHTATGPTLGTSRDTENDAQTPLDGSGDDVNGTDDEDGVTPGILIPGTTATFTVNASAASFLNAWIDFNADGDFAEAGEQVFSNRALVSGNNALTVAIPAGSAFGLHYARFRLTSASVATPSPVGLLPDGEVEDYALSFSNGTLCENFDAVIAPVLPAGWISQSGAGTVTNWVTTTTTPFSAPNAAFVTDLSTTSDTRLLTPLFTYSATSNQLVFRNFYQTESGFDFATLDISINGGAFTDILTAGGSFVTGGYNSASGWTGSSGSYILTTVNLPVSGLGQVVQLRWQLTTDSSVGANGWRVDDVCTQSPPTLDFGDAPNSFGTTLASNGARHTATGPTLGPTRDTEADAQAPLDGTGDDLNNTDDEDGVTPGILIPGTTATFTVNASAASFLNAWIDFNADGDFAEAGEQVATNRALVSGNNSVSVAIPGSSAFGLHYARFRLTSASVATPSPVGLLPDGEVEDYALSFSNGTLCESFDTVTAPALPAGWSTVFSGAAGAPWVTSTTTPFSAPNDAFVPDNANIGDNRLNTPSFTYAVGDRLTFRNFYNLENTFDGGVLEISVNGGAFTDILAAGGTFLTGGYNGTISTAFGNPLGGRQAWTGNAGGYILTTVVMPAASAGQVVQLRWREGTDNSVSATGWRIDDPCVAAPPTLDFGDAPDSFGTTLASNGARHTATGPTLGANRDTESDAQAPLNGTGDDVNGTPDDEDGVTFGFLIPGGTGTATVNVQGGSGFLNAWVDFNGNGSFGAGEQIATNLAVVVGNNTVTFAIPVSATPGVHYTRFRLTSASVATPSPLGLLPDGEVEDHAAQFAVGVLCENFDAVTAPALPAGWSSVAASGAQAWTTSTTTPFSAPNDAFIIDASTTTDTSLVSPFFMYTAANNVLAFRNFYNTENGFDFASLEIAINGGAFTNIVTAGGVFFSGAPNGTLNRWTGDAGGYVLSALTMPAAGYGLPVQLRWRLTTDGSVGTPGWRIDDICLAGMDFGDAPNTYGTTLASNGARHLASTTGPILGATRDTEADAATPLNGTGDDTTGTDDEDGVTFSLLVPGGNGVAVVSAPLGGRLDAWVDFNSNGIFDAAEQIATNRLLAAGTTNVVFAVPAGTATGSHFARFRISTVGGLAATGFATDGEVEDHTATVGTPIVTYADPTYTTPGTFIPDADPVTAGNQPAYVGVDAFNTIQAAVNTVAAGGTVNVHAATYAENVTIPAAKSGITLQGNVVSGLATDVVIDPVSGDALTDSADNVTVRTLRTTGAANGIVVGNVSGVTLNNVRSDTNTLDGIYVGVLTGAASLTGVTVSGNTVNGLEVLSAGSVSIASSSFNSNSNGGIALTTISGAVTLTSVTANSNTGSGIGIFSAGGAVTATSVTATGNVNGNGLSVGQFGGSGTSVTISGGTFSTNGVDGIHLENLTGAVDVSSVAAGGNTGNGLFVFGAAGVTVSGGTFSGIDVENVDSFTLNPGPVTSTKDVIVNTLNAVTFNTDLTVGPGVVFIVANLDFAGSEGFVQTAGTVSTTDTSANAIYVEVLGSGSIAAGAMQTGAGGSVTLLANGGAIIDNNGAATNVTAGTLLASADSGIDLDTAVDNLTATNGGTGDVTIDEADDVNVLNVSAASGNATVTSAAGSLNVSVVSASGTATLTAANAITDGNGAANNVTATMLALSATTGIGVGDALETAVANLEAQTDSGGIFVSNMGDVTIGGVTAALAGVRVTGASGAIQLDDTGSVFVTRSGELVKGPDAITINATVDIQTGGNNDGTAESGSVDSTGGTTTLDAGQDILLGVADFNGFGDTVGGGSIVLDAGRDITVQGNTFVIARTATGTLTGTAGRNISILESAAVSSQGGTVMLTATGDFVMDDLFTLLDSTGVLSGTVPGGDIFVTATNLFLGGDILSGTGDISLTATTGSITDTNVDGLTRVTGDDLTATAVTGILLETNVATLTATTSGTGDIDLQEADIVDVRNVSAAAGNASVRTDNGDINLTTISASDTVTLTATNGALTDANAAANNVTATDLILNADVAIATAADPLETTVSSLTYNSGAGGIYLVNDGALLILSGTGSGDADLTTLSPMTVAGNLVMGGNITLTATEVFDPGVWADDLTVNGGVTVQSITGDVTLQAGDDVILQAGSLVKAAGTVTITAAYNDTDGSGTAILDGTIMANAVSLCSLGDLSLGLVMATGTVTISSTNGAITDSNGGTDNVQAAALAASAATGIGVGDGIETAVANLEAETGTGGIFISNTGDLTVGNVTPNGCGIISLSGVRVTGGSGDIDVSTTGSLFINVNGDVVAGPAAVSVNAGVDIQTGGNNGAPGLGAVDSSGGLVTLTAGQDILIGEAGFLFGDVIGAGGVSLNATRDINVRGGSSVLALGAGAVNGTAGRDFSLSEFATIGADTGGITLSAVGTFSTGTDTFVDTTFFGSPGSNIMVTAGDQQLGGRILAGTADVTLTANVGAITDTNLDGATRVQANDLTASAVSGILLETAVDTIVATTSAAGNIDLRELDGVNLTNVTTADGRIDATTGGNTTATNVVSATDSDANDISISVATGDLTVITVNAGTTAGDASLTTTTGNIFDEGMNGTTLTADVATLTAFRAIGAPGTTAMIDTAANSLVAATTGAGPFTGAPTPGIWVTDVDSLTITSATTGDGVILIDAGTSLDAQLVTAGGTNRNVRLRALGGDLHAGSITAAGDTVLLTATGAITDGDAGNDVTALRLALVSGGDIGTAGDPLETTVSLLAWNSGTGSIDLTNTGGLTITSVTAFGLTTTGGSGSGHATVTALSPMTVAANVVMGGAITLTATDGALGGDDLVVNGGVTVQSTGDNITLCAGDDLTLTAGSTVDAFANVLLEGDCGDADAGLGSTITIAGVVNNGGTGTAVGNGDVDRIVVLQKGTGAMTLDGRGSGDTYFIQTGSLTGDLTIADTGASGIDRATINGTALAETFDVNRAVVGQVTSDTADLPIINFTTSLEELTVDGDLGNDTFNVCPSLSTVLNIDGDSPTWGQPGVPPGDTLNLCPNDGNFDVIGKSIVFFPPSPPYQNINFFNIEKLDLNQGIDPDTLTTWRFDLNSLPPTFNTPGYTSVLPNSIYTPTASLDFGWATAVGGFDRGAPNSLYRDGNYGGNAPGATPVGTFRADVANGVYLVSVVIGDKTFARDSIEVTAEGRTTTGVFGLNTAAGQFTQRSFLARVTDGTLDLQFRDRSGASGDPYWVVNSIEIRPAVLLTLGLVVTPAGPSVADGATLDTVSGFNAQPNAVLTVATDLGTIVTADADPNVAGLQVVADASGNFSFQLRRPTGAGMAFITAFDVTGRQTGCVSNTYILPDARRFDFNAAGSPTQTPSVPTTPGGFIGVLPTDAYSTGRGYGWLSTTGIGGFDRGTPNALLRDGNFSTIPVSGQFRADVQPGTYRVTATIGDATFARDRIDLFQTSSGVGAYNINTAAGQFAVRSFDVTVGPDGNLSLTIRDNGGDPSWVINGLEIRRVSAVAPITVTAPGGSLEANGMSVDAFTVTAPAGALVTLSTTLGTVTGVADASAAYAGIQIVGTGGVQSFNILRPSGAGTAVVSAEEVTGASFGSTTQTYIVATTRRFDFNGPSGFTATAFLPVRGSNLYSAAAGFGWAAAVGEFERPGTSSLRRDGNFGSNTTPGTFSIQVKPGVVYNIRVYVGDLSFARNFIRVAIEGAAPYTITSLAAGQFDTRLTTGAVSVDDTLTITISDLSGALDDPYWVINGIDIFEATASDPGVQPERPSATVPGVAVQPLTPRVLAPIVTEAINRWIGTGLTADQVALLRGTLVQIDDLNRLNALGLADVGADIIRIDNDAVGRGWFVDATPADDREFSRAVGGTEYQVGFASPAADRVDLLTVVEHELGHILGLTDLDAVTFPNELMTASLGVGVRRLPKVAPVASALDQVFAAERFTNDASDTSTLLALARASDVAAVFDGNGDVSLLNHAKPVLNGTPVQVNGRPAATSPLWATRRKAKEVDAFFGLDEM